MNTIGNERLEFYAKTEPPFGYTGDDVNTMARELLALRKEREAAVPAIHRWRRVSVEPYGPYPWHYEDFTSFSKPAEGIEDEYFYDAPPAQPVAVPDEATWEDAPANCENVDWAQGWNACRAAMLKEAK